MKRFGILLIVALGVGSGLGSCTSAMDYTSSIGDQEALSLGRSITPAEESNRLIAMLTRMKLGHHRWAIDEIEGR